MQRSGPGRQAGSAVKNFTLRIAACAAFLTGPSHLFAADGQASAATVPTAPAVQPCELRDPGNPRPRIGVVLGGGGARGIAHIRVLRMLEKMQVPVDCIAGTSMGSLVGALYASGMSIDDIEQLVLSLQWKEYFSDALPRRDRAYRRKQEDRRHLTTLGVGLGPKGLTLAAGLSQGERIIGLFEEATADYPVNASFDELPIPFRAIATDLNTGDAVVLADGNLPMAMRASMSLPGIFQPVEIDGKILIDGGIADQVPVDVARQMGADHIIAVDVGTPLSRLDRGASLIAVLDQLSGLLTTGSTRRQLETLGTGDLLIRPELGDKVSTGDFNKVPQALEIGQQAAEAAAADLARFSLPADVYRRYTEKKRRPVSAPADIEFVRVDNHTGYDDALLLSYLPVEPGKPLDNQAMQDGVLKAYGLGTLSDVGYQVVREDGRTGVLVTAHPKPQGPSYLQAGLTLNTDLHGDYGSNVRAGLLFSPLSRFGAEGSVTLQIGSEPGLTGHYYFPFDARNRYALDIEGGYTTQDINVFDGQGNKLARYGASSIGLEVLLLRQFANTLSVSAGLRRASGRADLTIGNPSLPEFRFQEGAALAMAEVDTIDSLYFPRSGYFARLGYVDSREGLGADTDFEQLDFDTIGAFSAGPHAFQFGARYHVTTQGIAPIQDLYRLGGRSRLVGFQRNELTGQHYAVLLSGYTFQLANIFGRSAQAGFMLEYGNAWERRRDIDFGDGIWNGSLFVGFDSWFGPLIFGYGMREGGNGVVFLEIGQGY